MFSFFTGMLYDATKSYAISFHVSGAFILLSAVMCYPINRISKWEKKRAEENEKLKSTVPTSLVDKV